MGSVRTCHHKSTKDSERIRQEFIFPSSPGMFEGHDAGSITLSLTKHNTDAADLDD